MDCTKGPKLPPVQLVPSAKVEIDPFWFEAELATAGPGETEMDLSIGRKLGEEGPGFRGTLHVTFGGLAVNVDSKIEEGKVISAHAHLEGLKRLGVKVEAGSESGRNYKVRLEIPIEFNVPWPGVPPCNVNFGYKAIVEMAVSGNNSTISGEGEITFDGSPVGFDYSADGKTVLRDGGAKVTKEPADHVEGVSIGVTGFVVAVQFEVMVGIGTRVLAVGPFAAITVSVGLTNGSSIGIIKCKQASVDVILAGGLGHKMDRAIESYLKRLLPSIRKSESKPISASKTLLHGVQVRPQMAACGLMICGAPRASDSILYWGEPEAAE